MPSRSAAARSTPRRRHLACASAAVSLLLAAPVVAAEGLLVLDHVKLDDAALAGALTGGGQFGLDVAGLGDVNGDGVPDIVVGARAVDAAGTGVGSRGSFWLIFLDEQGQAVAPSPIRFADDSSDDLTLETTSGSNLGSFFGDGIAPLPDYDGDATDELKLAVGASGADPGAVPEDSGAVYLVDIDKSDWTISNVEVIASGSDGFATLAAEDRLGQRVENLGDWDQDGAPELAVPAFGDNDGAPDNGAFYIVYLDPDGSGAKTYKKFSDTQGGFDGVLDGDIAFFGTSVANVGDLDGDTQDDLVVGATREGASGALFTIFMDLGCKVNSITVPHPSCLAKPGSVKIAAGQGGFGGPLASNAFFGISASFLGAEGGLGRLVVGANAASSSTGELWVLTLEGDGTVASEERIASEVGWNVSLPAGVEFGIANNSIGDWNGDGVTDLIVGAWADDTGASNKGAAWLLALRSCTTVFAHPAVFQSALGDGSNPCGPLQLDESWATLPLYLELGPDLSSDPLDVCRNDAADGDEVCAFDVRIAVEPPFSIWDFAPASGVFLTNGPPYVSNEVRVLWVDPDAPAVPGGGPIELGDLTVIASEPGAGRVRVVAPSAAVRADLDLLAIPEKTLAVPEPEQTLGIAVGVLGLAVLARRRTRAARLRGAGLVLLVAIVAARPEARAATSVEDSIAVAEFDGGLNADLSQFGNLGASVASLDGLDVDGNVILAVGEHQGRSGTDGHPARVWLLFLNEDGRVEGWSRINENTPNMLFGRSVASLGDLDGPGGGSAHVLAIGANGETPATTTGTLTLVRLNGSGTELSRLVLDGTTSGLAGLDNGDHFGVSVAGLGDIDSNGTYELAVGAAGDDEGGADAGAMWILSLQPSTGSVVSAARFSPAAGLPGAMGVAAGDFFGAALTAVGDFDGDDVIDLAVGATGDDDGGTDRGSVYLLYLESPQAGTIGVKGFAKISSTTGNLPVSLPDDSRFGFSLSWAGDPTGQGGGLLYVGQYRPAVGSSVAKLWPVLLRPDGTVDAAYELSHGANVGFVRPPCGGGCAASEDTDEAFGVSVAATPDMNGDETPDLAVGAFLGWVTNQTADDGVLFLLFMHDSDHDGLDDNLDNCPSAHDPTRIDSDGDGQGDECDNCVHVANSSQANVDSDEEGDACEPVEVLLETTGSPSNPTWSLWLECGAYSVTDLAGAIVLPAGATSDLDCPGSAVGCLALTGTSIGASTISGPGLVSPGGVRSDAIYFEAAGNGSPDNRLCTALDDPVLLGTLQAGPITGIQHTPAALTLEGVGTPGFENEVAETTGGPVSITDIRFVNAVPLPKLDLELGPAIVTGGGTRWEVCIPRADHEFHRVAFGLMAPAGTDTSDMRWVGCNTTPDGNGMRSCTGGTGFGATVDPAGSFTVGPKPTGTPPHTLYVVLEGNRFSSGDLDTLNFVGEGVCLGAVELDSSPDLEPALTTDGLETLGVTPFALADSGGDPVLPGEVKLIGKFNPADDIDGDDVQDLGDNCPFIDNTAQLNRGSFDSDVDESDSLGDACQCGESSDDGAVLDPDDFEDLADYLAGLVTNPVIAAEIEARCSVVHTTECNVLDLVHLWLALDGALPGVETRCDAALAPPGP